MNIPSEILLCGCTSGVILVRPCPEPAAFTCSRCECPLCRKHGRPAPSGALPGAPATVLCPACYAESGRGPSYARDRDGDGWTGASFGHPGGHSRNSGDFRAQESGTEEEGGADEDRVADSADEPFSSDDYAAFDAVSDYDRNADLDDGYDS